MNKIVKYIGYYDINENSKENRNHSLAATTKMDYICKAINNNGYKVLIVSPSSTSNNKFYRGKQLKVNENTDLKLFSTFPWGNLIQKSFSLLMGDIMLFWYLITRIKKNEMVIVYHSLYLRNIINLAKKIKGFKVILEVEEIYQDVVCCSEYTKNLEYKSFANADKFIFPTKLLDKKINPKNNQKVIIHGTYQVEYDRKVRFPDDKIHVVYAGTFEPKKGGAAAAAAAAFLSENYHMHIIGFGSKEQVKNIQDTVENINNKSSATVTYDGLLTGEEYIQFLQKCHVGLSTQNPDAEYNDTSFPSKILSYMANGLRVVSIRIRTVETSSIADKVYFYDRQSPKDIADTIMNINFNDLYDSRQIIRTLDEKFVKEIGSLLEIKDE